MPREDVNVSGYVRDGKFVRSHSRSVDKKLDMTMGASSALIGAGALNFVSAQGKAIVQPVNEGNTYRKFNELFDQIKPGDILVTGERDNMTFARFAIGLGTGNAEVYHTSVVNSVGPDFIECIDFTPAGTHFTRYDRLGRVHYPQIVRDSKQPGFIEKSTRNISVLRGNDPALVQRALENHRKRKEGLDSLLGGLIRRGIPRAEAISLVGSTFKMDSFKQQAVDELFTPFFTPIDAKQTQTILNDATAAVDKLHKNSDKYAGIIAARYRAGSKSHMIVPPAIRGVCSTAAAASGFPVIGNKSPHRASPLDAMRSHTVSTIGHFRPDVKSKSLRLKITALRVAPYAVRAGVGGALGYGAYRLGKAVLDREKTAGLSSGIPRFVGDTFGSVGRTLQKAAEQSTLHHFRTGVATPDEWTALMQSSRKAGAILRYGISSAENSADNADATLGATRSSLREMLRAKRSFGYTQGITE